MEDVLSVQQPVSLFKTTYSLAIRIWHWLFFVTITASIVMVLLASSLFTMKGNIDMVQEQVQQKGGLVSPQQARAVAHEYNDKLWNLHKYIGFGLCFLLICRMVIEGSYAKEKRLSGKIKKAMTFQGSNRLHKDDQRHYLLVKWGYVIFYVLFLIMALTGLGLALEDVPFLRSIHEPLAEVHSIVQYLIYLYILSHIIGVIRADLTNNKGIVSRMINGG